MEAEFVVDQPHKAENLSKKSMKKLDEDNVLTKDNGIEPSSSTIMPPSLVPITPDSNKETGDLLLGFSSPLTVISSPYKLACFGSRGNHGSSPHTPVEVVFDPFAPGPDKLMLAPNSKKYLEESRSKVAKRLNFDSSLSFVQDGNIETDAEIISDDDDDEILLETVYDTLLEAIVSKQTEGLLSENLPMDPGSDGFQTPKSAARLSGIAETCPGAPVKSRTKFRNIDQGLCRKLEF